VIPFYNDPRIHAASYGGADGGADYIQQRIASALERIAAALEALVAQTQPVPSGPESAPTPEISRGDYFRKDLGERREGAWHQAYTHRRWAGKGELFWKCQCGQRAMPMPGRSDRAIEVSRTRPTSGLFCKALRDETR
jgi:hypothetical protein